MIDYDGKRWAQILFRVRGSVVPRLLLRVLAAGLVGGAAYYLFHRHGVKIPAIAHTLIGVALGLLLVFRTNASYDRYWEGRRLLGMMVNRSRDLTRQLAALVGPGAEEEVRTLRRWTSLFFRLIAQELRGEDDLSVHGALLTDAERTSLAPVKARAVLVTVWMTRCLAELVREGKLTEQRLQLLDANLTSLHDSLGGCERILRTPVPFAYAQHIKLFVVLFCFTVPFAMAETMQLYTPAASAILAFALFGIDEIGVEIEDPFGKDPNDLPVDRIGEGIERVTSEMLARGA